MSNNHVNVIQFAQTISRTRKFRHDYPITKELQKLLVLDVYSDFVKYMLGRFYFEAKPFIDEFTVFHPTTEKKTPLLVNNLFWWYALNQEIDGHQAIEEYIQKQKYHYRKKSIIPAWLREWNKAVPKFYQVVYRYNDNALVLMDIFEKKPLDVNIYDHEAVAAKEGEIVAGTLIPIGNSLYFPIIDFYHFDIEATEEIITHILLYYEQYNDINSMHQFFLHLLSIALQVESRIIVEKEK